MLFLKSRLYCRVFLLWNWYLQKVNCYDAIIVGGGLAGLTSALELSGRGYNVAVFEKSPYPRHKVCGEYLSREVVPYLENLGVDLSRGVGINTFKLSTRRGKSFTAKLPLGGIGISRYALDNALYRKCSEQNVRFYFETVDQMSFEENKFKVYGALDTCYQAKVVIGAYGKRSNLDKALDRPFIKQKSPWLAVKAHYTLPDFPENQVALHNFEGGYCGLSRTETGAVNMCYLASYDTFSRYKDIQAFNKNILSQNPHLNAFFEKAKPLWEQPLSIAQISFAQKKAVANHILFCGDTAGLIHPLCGNGMAMAIHSAKLAAEGIAKYIESADFSRKMLEDDYARTWKRHFDLRLRFGRSLQHLLIRDQLSGALFSGLAKFPGLTNLVIRKTHGNPISV